MSCFAARGLPNPEIESVSSALQADSIPTELPGKCCWGRYLHLKRLWGNSPGSPLHFLVAQTVKNLPAMQETWVRLLGEKDPLEKGIATHSSILAWRSPWTQQPGRLQSMGLQRVGHN